MGDLTKNFSSWEFRCVCGRYRRPTDDLLGHLQRLRDAVGRPLTIVSGYRCRADNKRVGGAWNSRHLVADAADIPGNYCTLDQALAAGFHSIGVRRGRVIHVDAWPGRKGVVFPD